MATKTTTYMIDDLTGEQGTDQLTIRTVDFSLDGQAYEIDLTDANTARLRDALAQFVAAARKASSKTASATRTTRITGAATARVDREQNQAIRRWARDNGYPVSDRGRIPVEVSDAYNLGGEAAAQRLTELIAERTSHMAAQLPTSANGGQPAATPEFANA